jgi:putative hydrolase
MAKKYKVLVAINSDTHICYNVGENEKALALAAKVGIRPSQIINSSSQMISYFLDWHKKEAARKKA